MASSKSSANTKTILVATAIVMILGATAILINVLNRIPDNDPLTIGNTAGNLNNYGTFCESDGKVYFANPYDGGSLYSMNPDQSEITRLYEGNFKYINAGGNYLYASMESSDGGTGLGYVLKTTGIYRVKKNGKSIKCISDDISLIMSLSGNDLYYQAPTGFGVGLKKLDVTKTKQTPETIEATFVLNPACIENGSIYYGGTEKDHYLYSFDPNTNTSVPIWGGNVWNPVYDSGYFYYMDISNDYCICRYSPQTQSVDILSHERVDMFNVGYGEIFYSTSTASTPGLYRMSTNGGDAELLFEGIVSDINITSTFTYFKQYGLDSHIFCVPTYGGNYVSEFMAASDAVTN